MLTIDPDARLVYVDDVPARLTALEYELFLYLYRHAGHLCGRDELLTQVWGNRFAYDTGTLDVHIHAIRRKLKLAADRPIRTIRGAGYMYMVESASSSADCDLQSLFSEIVDVYSSQWAALKMKVDIRLDPFIRSITIEEQTLRRMMDTVMPLFLVDNGQLTISTAFTISQFSINLKGSSLNLVLSIPIAEKDNDNL